jgi:outer membrane protein TolC
MRMQIFSSWMVTIVVGVQLALPGTGQALTMAECVAMALKNNPDQQKQRLDITLADQEINQEKSRNFGRLDFISGYSHYNTPRTLTPMTPATMAGSPETVPTTRNLFTTGIVYEVPLFTGFAQTRAVEIAHLRKQMARAAIKLSREQLIYNVKTLYVNVLSLKAQAKAQDEYVSSLERLHDDVAAKLRLGRLAKIDLLKADADLQNGRAVARQIRSNLAIMRGGLAALLAVEELDELEDVPLSGKTMQPAPRDIAGKQTLENLARIRKEELNIEKNDKAIDRAASVYYPQLAISSSYGQNYGPNDGSHINSGDWENQEVWQAGLTLKWNIFDFGATRAAIQKSRLAARQSRLARQQTELDLKKNLLEAAARINTAIANYNSARAEAAMTRETEAIEQVRFDQGAADIVDLLTTKARNRLARSRLIDSGYTYLSNRYYLDYLLEQGENK